MGWAALGNGKLLRAAVDSGFDAFICVDKNIEYQQNLLTLPLPVVIIDSVTNALLDLMPFAEPIQKLLQRRLPSALFVIESSGSVEQISQPRPRKR